MATIFFKFIQRLTTPAPINEPLTAGDRIDQALNKLQGQINAGGGSGNAGVSIDGGNATTTYTQPAIRIDFGAAT